MKRASRKLSRPNTWGRSRALLGESSLWKGRPGSPAALSSPPRRVQKHHAENKFTGPWSPCSHCPAIPACPIHASVPLSSAERHHHGRWAKLGCDLPDPTHRSTSGLKADAALSLGGERDTPSPRPCGAGALPPLINTCSGLTMRVRRAGRRHERPHTPESHHDHLVTTRPHCLGTWGSGVPGPADDRFWM